MRNSLTVILCGFLLLAAVSAVANDYHIKLSVMSSPVAGQPRGSGGFYASDLECGRVVFRFYEDTKNFSVSACGTKQVPVTLVGGESRPAGLSEVADFYLTPTAAPNNQIRLKGKVLTFARVDQSDTNLYRYAADNLDFTIPNGGDYTYTIDLGNGKSGIINISASSEEAVVYAPKTTHYVDFQGDYAMSNVQTGQIEIQGKCNLGMGADNDEGQGSCFYHKVYDLENGDSLLYMSTFNISDVSYSEDGSISYTVRLLHVYALNPDMETGVPGQFKSEKSVEKTFERKITAKPDEKTVIEIPEDKESQLPFPSTEKLTLTTTLTTRKL
jgi:hypothetical protein